MRIDRDKLANFIVLVVITAAISSFLEGPAFWIGAVLVSGVTAYGAHALLSQARARGAPLASLLLPAMTAFAAAGLARGLGAPIATLGALAIGALVLTGVVEVELRLLGPADDALHRLRQQLVLLSVIVAFLAFAAASAVLHGGAFTATGLDASGSDPGVALIVVDALVALVLGYRLSTLRTLTVAEAGRDAGTFAAAVGVAAAIVRAIALPALLAPAVLAAVFYLWSGYRSAVRAERRSNAWLWEYLALAGAAALAIIGNLLLR